jgi:hypothetical protein
MSSRRRRRRRPVAGWLLRAAGLLIVFAIGVAVGQTLDDSAAPSGTQTSVHTFAPVTLRGETITVTVTTSR